MINLMIGFGQMCLQVSLLGDSAFVVLLCVYVDFRIEAQAVLVEDGEELTRHCSGCGYRLEDCGVQWDMVFLTLVSRGIPYGYKGVV